MSAPAPSSASTHPSLDPNPGHQPTHPHAQGHDHLPLSAEIGNPGEGLEVYEEQYLYASSRTPSVNPSPPSSSSDDGDHDNEAWPTSREGSIARRPRWRKPSPLWLYPFMVGMAIAIGAGVAPRSEIYVNLACLAHPPERTSNFSAAPFGIQSFGASWGGKERHGGMLELDVNPADEWFKKVQREMWEWEHRHQRAHRVNTTVPATTSTLVLPSGPLPKPTNYPIGGGEQTPQRPVEVPSDEDEDEDGDEQGHAEDNTPYREIDPKLCKKSPGVQAAAARLTMVMTLTMGILSALTTGYWGQTSDRLGRTKVLAMAEIGLLCNEVFFTLVATFPHRVPFHLGYRALLVGPTIEGCLGGVATIMATMNAYVSDVTPDGSRVTAFARLGGILMAGFACGPVLGSFLIKLSGNIMIPFYINIVLHTLYIPLLLFLLPESLGSDARARLAKRAQHAADQATRRDELEREWEDHTPFFEQADPLLATPRTTLQQDRQGRADDQHSKRRKRFAGLMRRLRRRMIKPLEPLEVFWPREREDGRPGRDWNLTFVGGAIFCMSMIYGIIPIKAQYTFFAYGWTSAQLGPFMSLVSVMRALVLIALLPTVMNLIRPRFFPNPPPPTSSSSTPSSSAFTATSDPAPHPSSAHLDLLTARVSLFIESMPYLLLSLAPTPLQFTALSALATLGAGSAASATSLALALIHDPAHHKGRLFGALSVLNSIGSSLVSPLMFGTVYGATVGKWTGAVFALGTGWLVVALVSLLCVRLRQDTAQDDREAAGPGASGAGGGAGGGGGGDEGRGRSRRKKRVSSSYAVNGFPKIHVQETE